MPIHIRSKKYRKSILPLVQQDTCDNENLVGLQVALITLFFIFGSISISLYVQNRLNYLIYGIVSILFLLKTVYITKFVLKQKNFKYL